MREGYRLIPSPAQPLPLTLGYRGIIDSYDRSEVPGTAGAAFPAASKTVIRTALDIHTEGLVTFPFRALRAGGTLLGPPEQIDIDTEVMQTLSAAHTSQFSQRGADFGSRRPVRALGGCCPARPAPLAAGRGIDSLRVQPRFKIGSVIADRAAELEVRRSRRAIAQPAAAASSSQKCHAHADMSGGSNLIQQFSVHDHVRSSTTISHGLIVGPELHA